jgi:hypothetical protein
MVLCGRALFHVFTAVQMCRLRLVRGAFHRECRLALGYRGESLQRQQQRQQ